MLLNLTGGRCALRQREMYEKSNESCGDKRDQWKVVGYSDIETALEKVNVLTCLQVNLKLRKHRFEFAFQFHRNTAVFDFKLQKLRPRRVRTHEKDGFY